MTPPRWLVSTIPQRKREAAVKVVGIMGKNSLAMMTAYMQKAGDCGDISPQIFLDFPQNFRLRTRNQYCTQAIA